MTELAGKTGVFALYLIYSAGQGWNNKVKSVYKLPSDGDMAIICIIFTFSLESLNESFRF